MLLNIRQFPEKKNHKAGKKNKITKQQRDQQRSKYDERVRETKKKRELNFIELIKISQMEMTNGVPLRLRNLFIKLRRKYSKRTIAWCFAELSHYYSI